MMSWHDLGDLSSDLVLPVKELPDVAEHTVLNDDEGGRHLVKQCDSKTGSLNFHLKSVNVGVEGIGEPGSGHSIFICSVVQLGKD